MGESDPFKEFSNVQWTLIGFIILIILFKWIKNRQNHEQTINESKHHNCNTSPTQEKYENYTERSKIMKSSKRKVTNDNSRRNKKGSNRSWLLSSVHTNRKSINENQGGLTSNHTRTPSPVSSESSMESSDSSPCECPVLQQGLSRRQKKNRSKHSQARKPEDSDEVIFNKKLYYTHEILHEFKTLNMPQDKFVEELKKNYTLTKKEMAMLGYPLRRNLDSAPTNIERRISDASYRTNFSRHYFNPSAVEFVPRSSDSSTDSGNGSSSSSEEEQDTAPNHLLSSTKWKDIKTRVCARCGSFFQTTSKKYITTDHCLYHPGKIQGSSGACGQLTHSCCKKPKGVSGCTSAKLHVWAGPVESIVNSSFVETIPPEHPNQGHNYGVFSLDCEMSYTVTGLEVVKVTVVDITGRPVYCEFVQPNNEIVDFNTRYSGVTETDFLNNTPKTLIEVQSDLKRFVSSETILVGHGLENDLNKLKIIHKTVVDTAIAFPHYKGLPYKRSLKNLAQSFLNKLIQNSENGHDCFEDARTCMQLMLYRIKEDYHV
ncbi:hypothetical protein ABEB36_008343 [Hypothenemus hampei]|uniref:Exonuclease domain-containing protein n=1 Tax=Hypothenemus hampei TaxID=57062 RepID=A0ABD1ELZ0_HYPHA